MRHTAAAVLLLAATLSGCSTAARAEASDEPPPLMREFRGGWVASVNNGGWPPDPGMSADAQKKEAIRMLDRAVELKLNAIVFQVRPACDALYRSDLEPWSEYLSGTQGIDPGYDPLQFWIDEAHKRGLTLHAWFNPYRAKHAQSKSPVAKNHISKTHPEVVKQYGGYLWLDPGEPVAVQHSLAVFLDVVKRYDIDGVHMDDYFYPYQVHDPKTKALVDFPDEPSWQRYKSSGGKLERNDWRRENVNQFMEKLYVETKKLKPTCQVGVAPFGIWRPKNPPGIEGLDQYDSLYADAKKWLNQGWLDYFSPQLYWPMEGPQSFHKLLDWWIGENTKKRHVWPGMSVGRYNRGATLSMEVPNQLAAIRKAPGDDGFIFWSLNSVMRDTALTERLRGNEFAQSAVIPPSPWLDDKPPTKPTVKLVGRGDGASVSIARTRPNSGADDVFLWAVQAKFADGWRQAVVPANAERIPTEGATAIAVSAIDRTGNASERVIVKVPGAKGIAPTTAPATTRPIAAMPR